MTPDYSACTDGELACFSRDGQQRAFAEIVRRHKEPMYRVAKSCMGDPDEALDVVQEAFVAAFRNLARYDPSRSFRAWLARITINKCRDWMRHRAVRKLFTFPALTTEQADQVADPTPGTERAAADQEELARLERAIRELPRPLRDVLVLRVMDGLSQAETAEALEITEKAVETRLYRARGKLAGVRDSSG